MRCGALARRLVLPGLFGALLLSGCSGEDERVTPYPVQMPDAPPGQAPRVPGVQTHLTTLTLGAHQTVGFQAARIEVLRDVTDSAPEEIIDYYGDWLTAEGWEPVDGLTEFNGAPAGSWEGRDQRVMVFVVTLQERDIAVVLKATDQWEAP